MKKMQNLQIFLFLFCYSVNAESFEDLSGEKWLNHDYLLKWKTDNTAKSMTLRVEVRTKGWIGFGFSKHALTNEADIAIGWVDSNGKPTLKDFWVSESFTRSLDTSQDWHLITASENETHTVLEFCRKYITCDSEHDLEIFENEFERSNIVFSYGLTDPINIETIGDPFFEHVIHLNLFFPEDYYEPKEDDIQVFDYQLNVTLPPKSIVPDTTYCKLFKLKHNDKRTLVKSQGIVDSLSKTSINHHIGLFSCPKADPAVYENSIDKVFHCYDYKTADNPRLRCTTLEILQAVETDNVTYFPSHVGISLDPHDLSYFLMEVHLINPFFKPLYASATTRMWTTGKKRKYDVHFNLMSSSVGLFASNWGYIAPPKQSHYMITTVIDSYCFEKANMGNDGIFIFSVLFHTHHGGKDHEARHFRNDKLMRVLRYYNYDSNFQPFAVLKTPIHFLKGDKLFITCEVNSINETRSYTSPVEHCALGTYSYPKLDFYGDRTIVTRIPYQMMLNITGLQQIDNYDNGTLGEIVIRKPVQFNNTKLVDFVGDNKYRVTNPRQLEQLLISAEVEEFCSFKDNSYKNDGPSHLIKKPPGIYEQLINRRVQNTCPSDNGLLNIENPRIKSESTLFGFQSLNQLKLSFSVIMKSFKMSFALLV